MLRTLDRLRRVFGSTVPEPVGRQCHSPELRVGQHGFSVFSGSIERIVIEWKEVIRISAYKRDRGLSDLVCVELQDRAGRKVVIDEDMESFMAVVKQMRSEFPTIPQDWYVTAMLPGVGQELYKRIN